ncbi:MAG: ABC transporter ATP-binding protein [Acidobacteriaceae bacterium]
MAATALDLSSHHASALPAAIAELRGVTKRYGPTAALDNLSLSLYPGEIVALLGPNGAGKTTAVRILLGLTSPSAGVARVFSGDPRQPSTRTRIGAMLQVGNAPEVLTAREHLNLFRSYYPAPMPLPELIRIACLDGILDKQFGDLSGGQKQRMLFALALAGDPDVIFLDEPTVGMDIETRRALWSEVRALSARGKTVLLTTHYLEEADALATRVIVIDAGRILRQGTPSEIKQSGHARIVRCRTSLSLDTLRLLPGILTASLDRRTGLVTLEANQVEQLLRTLLLRDQSLSDLEVLTPALEDAFLALLRPPPHEGQG